MNIKPLFKGEILNDYPSWQQFTSSTEAFTPLIEHIYEINNLKRPETIYNKSQSDGVFRIDDTIIKIFFPPEVEVRMRDSREYTTELAVLQHAHNAGILVPDIICSGAVRDARYAFNYIVMNYIDGETADQALGAYTDAQKIDYAHKLKEIAAKLHVPNPGLDVPHFNQPGKIDHALWNNMPESFRQDRLRYIADAVFPEAVVCHGDMGGRNIIIDDQGRLYLIDFAESVHAPPCYDMPLAGEHGRDKILMEAYYGDYKNEKFYDAFTMRMLLGWFCGVSIKWLSEKAGFDFERITGVAALRKMLIQLVEGGD